MGFKSVMKKIGKIALTAAPYVAAPFTGGLSLMGTGLANKAVQKWSEHDAKDAIAHGLAPSHFDSILGKVGGIAGLASSFIPSNALGAIGMLGKAGSVGKDVASVASKVSGGGGGILGTAAKIGKGALGQSGGGWQGALGSTLGNLATSKLGSGQAQDQVGQNIGTRTGPGIGPTAVPRGVPSMTMPRGGYNYDENPLNQVDQTMPNLSQSIFQGRQEATRGGMPMQPPRPSNSIFAPTRKPRRRQLPAA